jgi:23S rRNA (adenine2030-N6)-methyltransferase
MKYRHAHHAGNFADVHKHVTLLALLAALARKDKGFLYFETHAGRGVYDLADAASEAAGGIGQLQGVTCEAPELRVYLERVAALRRAHGASRAYPGSPWLAVSALRPQDQAVFVELLPEEARGLRRALAADTMDVRVRIEAGEGFAHWQAALPPPQRRALTLIDPPYEDSRGDFDRVRRELAAALRRFPTGVIAVWYPVKDARDTQRWLEAVQRELDRPLLAAELRLFPCDSRVALNGSGMLIVNPHYQLDVRMSEWLAELHRHLHAAPGAAGSVRWLARPAA